MKIQMAIAGTSYDVQRIKAKEGENVFLGLSSDMSQTPKQTYPLSKVIYCLLTRFLSIAICTFELLAPRNFSI